MTLAQIPYAEPRIQGECRFSNSQSVLQKSPRFELSQHRTEGSTVVPPGSSGLLFPVLSFLVPCICPSLKDFSKIGR